MTLTAEALRAKRDLNNAVVTTPSGCLVGVFHRAHAEARLHPPAR